MFRFRSVAPKPILLVTLAMVTAACSADAPLAPDPGTNASVTSPSYAPLQLVQRAEHVAQHMVSFRGRAPRDFEKTVEAMGGSVVYTHGIGLALVRGLDDRAAEDLAGDKAVAEVVEDVVFDLDPDLGRGAVQEVKGVTHSPASPAGAYFYPLQWNMRAISADAAWAAGRVGSPEVTVAILDTGIDYTNPDLEGLVDLGRSRSFVDLDDYLLPFFFPGAHPITDLNFHGTHVAATVASNGSMAAGVTSQTSLMGVKVCDVNGDCPFSSVIFGVLYAADAGADVMNLSLGGMFSKREAKGFGGFINRVLNYANSQGVTVVVSAGNDAVNLDHDKDGFKAYCSAPNTICVAATGPAASGGDFGPWYEVDAPAPYSDYGRSAISVAAPGGTGAGLIWATCSQTSLVLTFCQNGGYAIGLGGTSMAAPHVSGLAALLVEEVGRRPGRIKTMIQQRADDLGKRGTDPFYGKGRINVFGTVSH